MPLLRNIFHTNVCKQILKEPYVKEVQLFLVGGGSDLSDENGWTRRGQTLWISQFSFLFFEKIQYYYSTKKVHVFSHYLSSTVFNDFCLIQSDCIITNILAPSTLKSTLPSIRSIFATKDHNLIGNLCFAFSLVIRIGNCCRKEVTKWYPLVPDVGVHIFFDFLGNPSSLDFLSPCGPCQTAGPSHRSS